jgi:alpha-tubulin suppressor-like RCC1 family protein
MSRAPALVCSLVLAWGCGGGGPNANAPASSGGDPHGQTTAADTASAASPRDIDCGDFSTCAVSTDDAVRCWGRDKRGELGDGAGSAERARRGIVPGLGKVLKVALASQFGCALLADKTVSCWGTGRIANDGRPLTEAKPTPVSGLAGVEELVASGAIACARDAKGTTCWGADEKTIGTVPKIAFKQIAAGFTHACGLDAAGSVTCWGGGEWAANGAFSKPGTAGAQQVATGDRHACVITKEKTVACWGTNDAGQLGTKSDVEPHKKPIVVPGVSGVIKLAAGEASTCALSEDGSVRCWGANGEGELGLGTRSPDERPAAVSSLSNVREICLASAHGCALTKDSKVLCWGSNAYGQLGDGTKERRSTPTPVAW